MLYDNVRTLKVHVRIVQVINVFQISLKIPTSCNVTFITFVPKTENSISLESEKIPTSCNALFIFLVLKTENPISLDKYGSISLTMFFLYS